MKITEIFSSLHGEITGHHQGRMCTFIRISGCNCNCWYCDTPHTQKSSFGQEMSNLQILNRVKEFKNKHICLTGGEPLLNKPEVLSLLILLKTSHFKISVETNGTIEIDPFFHYVDSFVLDYKIGIDNYQPVLLNYLHLRPMDVIKFVVDQHTIIQAINIYKELSARYSPYNEPLFAFSPILSKNFTTNTLYDLLKEQNVHDVIISVQLHKIINFP